MERNERKKNYLHVKRVLDILAAILFAIPALIIIAPLYIAIKIDDPEHHAFFVQERPGYHGKVFRMFKLRSMRVETDGENTVKYPGADRLTKVGRFLRKTSLDELPQIWNVLVGQMSFIGPRPLVVEYLPMYSAEQMRRHDVLPGITGWAQANGRNAVSWDAQFAMDVWYVDHVSFLLDCKIVLLTIKQVFSAEGGNSWEDRREAETDQGGTRQESPFDLY